MATTEGSAPSDEVRVGERVAQRRGAKRLTGQQLATQANVSIDTVRSIESGRVANPGINTVAKLADVLDASLDDLAGRPRGRRP